MMQQSVQLLVGQHPRWGPTGYGQRSARWEQVERGECVVHASVSCCEVDNETTVGERAGVQRRRVNERSGVAQDQGQLA